MAILRPFAGRVRAVAQRLVSASQPASRSCWSMRARVAASSRSILLGGLLAALEQIERLGLGSLLGRCLECSEPGRDLGLLSSRSPAPASPRRLFPRPLASAAARRSRGRGPAPRLHAWLGRRHPRSQRPCAGDAAISSLRAAVASTGSGGGTNGPGLKFGCLP